MNNENWMRSQDEKDSTITCLKDLGVCVNSARNFACTAATPTASAPSTSAPLLTHPTNSDVSPVSSYPIMDIEKETYSVSWAPKKSDMHHPTLVSALEHYSSPCFIL